MPPKKKLISLTQVRKELIIKILDKSRNKGMHNFSYEDFMLFTAGLTGFLKEAQSENRQIFRKKLKGGKEMLDLLLSEYMCLSLLLSPFYNLNTKSYNGYKKGSYKFKALRVFSHLLNNAFNALTSIKMLLSTGMDLQARILFRNYIESMETAIAVLLNEEFLQLYKSVPNSKEEAGHKWNKTRPQGVLKAIYDSVQGDESQLERWQFILEFRMDYYDDTSKAVHANIVPVTYSSYSRKIGQKGISYSYFGSHITNATVGTINNVLLYANLISNFILSILEKSYNFDKLKEQDSVGVLYVVVNDTNKFLNLHYLWNKIGKSPQKGKSC